jgi:hypothetical protein
MPLEDFVQQDAINKSCKKTRANQNASSNQQSATATLLKLRLHTELYPLGFGDFHPKIRITNSQLLPPLVRVMVKLGRELF